MGRLITTPNIRNYPIRGEKEKINGKNEGIIWILKNRIKTSNIKVIIKKDLGREKDVESLLKELMAENFANLEKGQNPIKIYHKQSKRAEIIFKEWKDSKSYYVQNVKDQQLREDPENRKKT